jgi:hypothetical protein
MAQQDQSEDVVDNAVAEGGAYEIIRKRLTAQGQQLNEKTSAFNEARLTEFGSSNMSIIGRVRVRTEHNCVARDIVQVGEYLLFGYNVFIGLKKETKIEDVFSLYRIGSSGGTHEMEPVSITGTFLSQPGFVADFNELYRYYKHTRLVQLRINHGKLLAGFQIGERLEDTRVFSWAISADGKSASYLDNRADRDIQLPAEYDFEWVNTTRDDTVHGPNPHMNILDTLFVETLHGDLTIKVENNTEDGLGIYREPVDDKTQSLDDAQIVYAEVGNLVLLKIRPYKEELWRYLIFNTLTQAVLRVDEIGQSCVQLPEDHGIIFPGGYYLESGEHKTFDDEVAGLKFKRAIRSPNGEDVLYVFYEPDAGVVGLFGYNLIAKELQNPIYGHGYALAEDGKIVIFSAESDPTRVHPMQIWETPYISAEYASKEVVSQSFYGRIGNAVLVRGISDLYSIGRLIDNQSASLRLYEELRKESKKIFDAHYWIESEETNGLDLVLKEISATAELVVDEFEKVQSIRMQSKQTMLEAETNQEEIIRAIRPDNWETVEEYVNALAALRKQRGHLITIKEHRYIDLDRLSELESQISAQEEDLNEQTVGFLSDDKALAPYFQKIEHLNNNVEIASTSVLLDPIIETIEVTASGLDLLSELMSTLKVGDPSVRTRIIDSISQVYSALNQSKAGARLKQKSLGSEEGIAQFGAQFKLFSQSITNALGMATTPERCDEQISRLLVQLEELESQFGDFDQFLSDIMDKREEIYESFETHKQMLQDERQRKAQNITDAANRILSSIEKRSLKFSEADELNTYFASDALVMKVRELVEQLRDLDSAVKADDIDARFKASKEQALRSLRDKRDIFEDGGSVIKLGPRHRFSVNTQELDLTIIPRNGELNVHLTGTNYFEKVEHAELNALSNYWDMNLESETDDVYRSEYLASLILEQAEKEENSLSMGQLREALLDIEKLHQIVRDFAAPRYREGYERGIHDHDATLLIQQLLPAIDRADLLRFDPLSRGLAQVFWANLKSMTKREKPTMSSGSSINPHYQTWQERAQSAVHLQNVFASSEATDLLIEEVLQSLSAFVEQHPIPVADLEIRSASEYLVSELSRERLEFIGSKYASRLTSDLKQSLDDVTWRRFLKSLENMIGWPAERWNLSTAWLKALVDNKPELAGFERYIPEAVALINSDERLERRFTEIDSEISVTGLLGDHPLIQSRSLSFSVDSFLQRVKSHRYNVLPSYHRYLKVRQEVIATEKEALRLEEFKPRPLSSFVRNRLINESYLPLIGDNFAKQIGTQGEDKRTDLMGLLMMISPPGYGKTTLMEYVASRLGLIFMKINCPSLGHDVLSFDPEQAPNATARQELEKLNLALEMGNNVMLYLDDIQHTHPEFLQKFISLCDGTRRVEGVWKGIAKTYDMRARKFCVVMAGNPYTESGEAFKIPDMLANRADIYNLGDILGGMDEQFSLSYIENAMTSNAVLAPLALREMDDIYKLINMAKGRAVAASDLSHQYSGAEINEITDILKKMFIIQDVILKINQQYIASAAQDDKYRTEPSFKLQGSYRNMNKMTEKISSVMNDAELTQLIADHYLGEAQLLTTGAESNLLKLSELRGDMSDTQAARWGQIKSEYLRNKAMGGDESDVGGKVVAQLVDLVGGVHKLGQVAEQASNQEIVPNRTTLDSTTLTETIVESLDQLQKGLIASQAKVEVINQPVPGIDKILGALADTMKNSIFPLIKTMDKKMEIDLRTHDKMADISSQLQRLEEDSQKSAKKTRTQSKVKKRPAKDSPVKP